MRASLALRAPQVSSNRTLREYAERLYLPAARGFGGGTAKNGHERRDLPAWAQRLAERWHDVRFGNLSVVQEGDR